MVICTCTVLDHSCIDNSRRSIPRLDHNRICWFYFIFNISMKTYQKGFESLEGLDLAHLCCLFLPIPTIFSPIHQHREHVQRFSIHANNTTFMDWLENMAQPFPTIISTIVWVSIPVCHKLRLRVGRRRRKISKLNCDGL